MNSNYFQTYDLGLASALIADDYELMGMDKSNPKKVAFSFEKNSVLERSVNEYWHGHLLIDARTLFETQKMLKNRIYSD